MAYKIGELAKKVGVPVSTVRYYERRGLVHPSARSEGNYRQYGEASLQRLRFIRRAQEAGFTLSNIETLLGLINDSQETCMCVQELIEGRLGEVREELQQLSRVEKWLGRLLMECKTKQEGGRCAVLDQLEHLE